MDDAPGMVEKNIKNIIILNYVGIRRKTGTEPVINNIQTIREGVCPYGKNVMRLYAIEQGSSTGALTLPPPRRPQSWGVFDISGSGGRGYVDLS